MHDADLVVPEERAGDALAVVDRMGGLRTTYGFGRRTSLRLHHGVNLESERGLGLDLHWHVLQQACFPGADEPFWRDLREFDCHGRSVRTTSAACALFVTCVHGALAAEGPLLRWVPDAMAILSADQDLCWDDLVSLAGRFRLTLVLEATLRILSDEFQAPIPMQVFRALEAVPVARSEVRYLESLRDTRRGLLAPARRYWADFWMRHGRERGIPAALPLFAPYLSDRIGTTSSRLPWYVLRRLARGHHEPPVTP